MVSASLFLLLLLAQRQLPVSQATSVRGSAVPPVEERRLAKPTCIDGTCRKSCSDCCPGGTECTTYEGNCGECGAGPTTTAPPTTTADPSTTAVKWGCSKNRVSDPLSTVCVESFASYSECSALGEGTTCGNGQKTCHRYDCPIAATTTTSTTTVCIKSQTTTTQGPTTTAATTTSVGTTHFVTTAQEISDAMATAQPGDTLLMDASVIWNNADIVFRGDGNANNPITLRSSSPTEPVVLTGSSRLRLSGSYLVVDGLRFESGSLSTSNDHVISFRTSSSELAQNCRVTNTAIINYNPSDSSFDYRWVGLWGTNNRVDHCYFSGKNHQGALMIVWRRSDNTPDFHQIDHNYFGDFSSGGGLNGWETIRIGTSDTSLSDSSSVVSDNLFERCDGEIEIISVKSGANVLKGNTFDSCEGMLTLRHGRGNTVDGNFFLGKGVANSGGVRIIDSDHVVTNNYFEGLLGSGTRAAIVFMNGLRNTPLNGYYGVERATVVFNTIYDCKEAIRIGERSESNEIEVKDSTIANNAVFSTSGVASTIIFEEAAPTNMLYEGNIMYGDGVSLGLFPNPGGISEVDPGLVIGPDCLYRPHVTSPCIDNAAGTYAIVTTDMDGQSRPSFNKDIGADEASNDSVTSGPLDSTDIGVTVGPSWM